MGGWVSACERVKSKRVGGWSVSDCVCVTWPPASTRNEKWGRGSSMELGSRMELTRSAERMTAECAMSAIAAITAIFTSGNMKEISRLVVASTSRRVLPVEIVGEINLRNQEYFMDAPQ